MSLSAPTRRLVSRCLAHKPPPPQASQRRTAMADFFKRGSSAQSSTDNSSNKGASDKPRSNPILDAYRRDNPEQAPTRPEMPKPGDLAPGSVFEDDRRMQAMRARGAAEGAAADAADDAVGMFEGRDPRSMARVLDPDPNARERWERKKVIQLVRKGGRLTKEQYLKRTEREHLVKSQNMKTSVKKLGMLARQIAGKPIDEAIVQMRFSKKRVAQEVLKQLEFARDEAVVSRGMGLSSATREITPTDIQLKDGSRHQVTSPSQIYIDQAWVGRGPYGQLPDYRARGRVFIMRTPWTSLTVLLKEEATRVREYAEREAKRLKRRQEKAWVSLPDRPVQIQRQWYSW